VSARRQSTHELCQAVSARLNQRTNDGLELRGLCQSISIVPIASTVPINAIAKRLPQRNADFFMSLNKPHKTMTSEEKTQIEERIVEVLKTVYDPEIPVDIFSLGLIYKIDLHDDFTVDIDMTLTAPNCPAADFIVEDVRMKVAGISQIKDANVNLVFEPEWDKDMMSEEAKLDLGFM
jgi:FeS assembly SUF system protein